MPTSMRAGGRGGAHRFFFSLRSAVALHGRSGSPTGSNSSCPPGLACSVYQSTLLHGAARQGHTGLAAELLRRGADPNALDFGGMRRTPLHWACRGGHVGLVELLVAAGGDTKVVCAAAPWAAAARLRPLHTSLAAGCTALAAARPAAPRAAVTNTQHPECLAEGFQTITAEPPMRPPSHPKPPHPLRPCRPPQPTRVLPSPCPPANPLQADGRSWSKLVQGSRCGSLIPRDSPTEDAVSLCRTNAVRCGAWGALWAQWHLPAASCCVYCLQ